MDESQLEQFAQLRELARYAVADEATLLMRVRGDSYSWCAGGVRAFGKSIKDLLSERDGSSVIPVCFRLDFDRNETFYWHPDWLVEARNERLLYFGTVPHGSIGEEIEFNPDETEAIESESHTPGQWTAAVQRIQAEIREQKLQKAVLSRQMSLYNPQPWQVDLVLAKLLHQSTGTSVFAHQLYDNKVWIGATPEILFQREGRQVTVDSLAGTRQTLLDDTAFSNKDHVEQKVVTDFLCETLSPLCSHVSVSPLTVRRADDLEHVYSQVQGVLRDGVNDDDVLEALHPTPAVCGSPRNEAALLLNELEPAPRDLYGGVLGFTNGHQTTAVVVLRCAQVQTRTARLFGGAGIVLDSDPEMEYSECGWKMEVMQRALTDLI
ncbi:MAG: chorismate-binding protein [Calditrichaeota bacterium]|nr:chorismate-binding protein [Calditrichota bacterium]MCB9369100.1 chorismate-binding protein [Calditrichota bacterium]